MGKGKKKTELELTVCARPSVRQASRLLFSTDLIYSKRFPGSFYFGRFKSLEIDFSIKGLLNLLIQPMGRVCLSGGPLRCCEVCLLKSIREQHFKVGAPTDSILRMGNKLHFCRSAANRDVTA